MSQTAGSLLFRSSRLSVESVLPNWRRRAPTGPLPRRKIRYKGGAGSLFPSDEGDLGRLVMDLTAIGIPTTKNSYAVRVEGDSMTGAGVNDGDILLVEKIEPTSGDIVVAVVDGTVTIKYLIIEGDRRLLRSANPNYPDRELAGEWSIHAVAVGLVRKLKQLKL